MTRTTNPSGYTKYANEKELCNELEQKYFPIFFDAPWKPILGIHKEVVITSENKCRVDYYGYKNNIPTWVEVKNWFATTKDIRQIYKYILRLKETQKEHYHFYLICGGIEEKRKHILEALNVNIILTNEIDEINQEEVVFWM